LQYFREPSRNFTFKTNKNIVFADGSIADLFAALPISFFIKNYLRACVGLKFLLIFWRYTLKNERIRGSGNSRMKKLGGHCGAKEKSRGPT